MLPLYWLSPAERYTPPSAFGITDSAAELYAPDGVLPPADVPKPNIASTEPNSLEAAIRASIFARSARWRPSGSETALSGHGKIRDTVRHAVKCVCENVLRHACHIAALRQKVIQRPRRPQRPVSLRSVNFRIVIRPLSQPAIETALQRLLRLTIFVRTVCPFALLSRLSCSSCSGSAAEFSDALRIGHVADRPYPLWPAPLRAVA